MATQGDIRSREADRDYFIRRLRDFRAELKTFSFEIQDEYDLEPPAAIDDAMESLVDAQTVLIDRVNADIARMRAEIAPALGVSSPVAQAAE